MKIEWNTIPHKKHRYETVGDWIFTKTGKIRILVSRLSDERYEDLVGLHEAMEALICYRTGIPEREVTAFDKAYEKTRRIRSHGYDPKQTLSEPLGVAPCGCEHYDEPGDDPHAPYFEAHQAATACEKIMAKALGVSWNDYNDEVESL